MPIEFWLFSFSSPFFPRCWCCRRVDSRCLHKPLSYISGRREFWSLQLEVNEATLIPRPDTETVWLSLFLFLKKLLRFSWPFSSWLKSRRAYFLRMHKPRCWIWALALGHFVRSRFPFALILPDHGFGSVVLATLTEYPNAMGVGVDISREALEVAARNAKTCRLDGRTSWLQSDWCSRVTGQFDLILSNPPYISEAEFEALDMTVKR